MKILISGANGFLGCSLIPVLAEGHSITGLWATHEPAAQPGVTWRQVDLCTENSLTALDERVDVVIHLAQSARYRDFPAAADHIFEVNVVGMQALLEYARRAGAKQLIVASTGSVYAASQDPVPETAAPAPPNYYGATKLAADVLAGAYASLFDVCVLRLFYPYGPGQRDRLIPNLIQQVHSGKPLQVQGTDGLELCPTFAPDVARVFESAVENRWHGTYNVATPELATIRSLGESIGRILGIEPVFEQTSAVTPDPLLPELAHLGTVFDLNEFTSVESGLELTVSAWANAQE